MGRRRDAARVPGPAVLVLEDAKMRAGVVEVDRRPEPEELRRQPGGAALGLADRPHAPRAVADAEDVAPARPQRAVPRRSIVPSQAPNCVSRVESMTSGARARRREARLLDRRGAGAEATSAAIPAVRRDAHAQRAQRLDHLDRDRPDVRLGALERAPGARRGRRAGARRATTLKAASITRRFG